VLPGAYAPPLEASQPMVFAPNAMHMASSFAQKSVAPPMFMNALHGNANHGQGGAGDATQLAEGSGIPALRSMCDMYETQANEMAAMQGRHKYEIAELRHVHQSQIGDLEVRLRALAARAQSASQHTPSDGPTLQFFPTTSSFAGMAPPAAPPPPSMWCYVPQATAPPFGCPTKPQAAAPKLQAQAERRVPVEHSNGSSILTADGSNASMHLREMTAAATTTTELPTIKVHPSVPVHPTAHLDSHVCTDYRGVDLNPAELAQLFGSDSLADFLDVDDLDAVRC